jgi:hypothetical protein
VSFRKSCGRPFLENTVKATEKSASDERYSSVE